MRGNFPSMLKKISRRTSGGMSMMVMFSAHESAKTEAEALVAMFVTFEVPLADDGWFVVEDESKRCEGRIRSCCRVRL